MNITKNYVSTQNILPYFSIFVKILFNLLQVASCKIKHSILLLTSLSQVKQLMLTPSLVIELFLVQ